MLQSVITAISILFVAVVHMAFSPSLLQFTNQLLVEFNFSLSDVWGGRWSASRICLLNECCLSLTNKGTLSSHISIYISMSIYVSTYLSICLFIYLWGWSELFSPSCWTASDGRPYSLLHNKILYLSSTEYDLLSAF